MKSGNVFAILAAAFCQLAAARDFVHPGGLLLQKDITRIRLALSMKTDPYYHAWLAFKASVPSPARQPHPYTLLTDAYNSTSVYSLQNDGHDAYALAVYWALTGDAAYGDAAVRMIKGWASALGANSGTPVATMRTGIGMNQLINAAELLRHANGGYPGYTATDIGATEKMLRTAVYPILNSAWGAVPAACGPPGACRLPYGDGNWGTAALAGLMAGAVFLSDSAWFQEAVEVYKNGKCSSLNRYILNDGIYTGETAESGRDQGHPQFGVGNLLQVAEMAWNQGLDLYGENDNLLLKGVEYLAKYGLGNTVPYKTFGTCQVAYPAIASQNRGIWYPIYEMAWNHYHNRRGLAAPFAEQVKTRSSPEPSVTDQFGFGTLLYTRPYSPQDSGGSALRSNGFAKAAFSLRKENGRNVLQLGQGFSAGSLMLVFPDACGKSAKVERSGNTYILDQTAGHPRFLFMETEGGAFAKPILLLQ